MALNVCRLDGIRLSTSPWVTSCYGCGSYVTVQIGAAICELAGTCVCTHFAPLHLPSRMSARNAATQADCMRRRGCRSAGRVRMARGIECYDSAPLQRAR